MIRFEISHPADRTRACYNCLAAAAHRITLVVVKSAKAFAAKITNPFSRLTQYISVEAATALLQQFPGLLPAAPVQAQVPLEPERVQIQDSTAFGA